MDRIDIFLDIPRIDYDKLTDEGQSELSESVRRRVQAARQIQLERFTGSALTDNADMTALEIRQFCKVDPPAQALLKAAMKQIHFTARAFHRTLKLARTVADLDGSQIIRTNHLAEALQYRQRNINQ
jgi:magnesium chelatase family protein